MGLVIISIFLMSLLLYYTIRKQQQRNLLLFIGSLSFYALLEGFRTLILVFIITITFAISRILYHRKNKLLLIAGISTNIAILLSYKYLPIIGDYSFFTFLPIGLSFYTFQAISYLVDIYKGKINSRFSFVEIGVYLSFFPKVLSGPIERADNFITQLREKKQFKVASIFTASKIILLALVLKYVVADNLGVLVNGNITQQNITNLISLLTTAAIFSFQIFLDFYAYSILAIALAMMYGIKLSCNFNYPYFSSSFRSFWRRWNMTLTAWLRDYIYIPLGGNRVRNLRWILNVFLVFVISGIWHNASLNFIIWGFLHGTFFVSEHFASKATSNKLKSNIILSTGYSTLVFLIISLLWLVFRIENNSQLIYIFKNSLNFSCITTSMSQIFIVVIMVFAIIILRQRQWIERYIFTSSNTTLFIIREMVLIDILIITLLLFAANVNSRFIYFKF